MIPRGRDLPMVVRLCGPSRIGVRGDVGRPANYDVTTPLSVATSNPAERWDMSALAAHRQETSEVAVDIHALVQDTHDIDNALGGDPVEQGV
jgi:hypothetical protein